MKYWFWIIVVFAVVTGGCGSSGKSPASGDIGGSLAQDNGALIDVNDSGQGLDEFGDDDFGLFEDELVEEKMSVPDPLEGLNRVMFGVNDVVYIWILEPCAKVCKAVLPEPVRIGVRNFFNNLATPARLANCLLQGKGNAAGRELHRFAINTTIGVLGIGDPALEKYDLAPAEEDLGQTLAVYGFDNGIYFVLPLLGPTTLRDGVGLFGDQFLNPIRYVDPTEASVGISMGKGVNYSSFRVGEYESFKADSVDPYVAMREAYIQYRNKKIEE
jgi:phospholipid-binding lipoprotein MlaA